MPMSQPPPPLSRDEFDKRYAAGARTLRELDPEFCEWMDRETARVRRGWVIVRAGTVVGLICFVGIALVRYSMR